MTVPQLYRKITLTSYDETLRYRDGTLDDGHWHASPFAMGLSALATRKASTLVEDLTLDGDWHEHIPEQYRNRRLPDGLIMLNIAIRAVIERCSKLLSFKYVCKLLRETYGLCC